jgi:hypothetical protein
MFLKRHAAVDLKRARRDERQKESGDQSSTHRFSRRAADAPKMKPARG